MIDRRSASRLPARFELRDFRKYALAATDAVRAVAAVDGPLGARVQQLLAMAMALAPGGSQADRADGQTPDDPGPVPAPRGVSPRPVNATTTGRHMSHHEGHHTGGRHLPAGRGRRL